ncbi:MAG: hypothetical protein P8I82_00525 [Flavobacteriales bacterium]|nr:hypothetical protein [Flavobacteriales bacterium]
MSNSNKKKSSPGEKRASEIPPRAPEKKVNKEVKTRRKRNS